MEQSPHSDPDHQLLALLRQTVDALQRARDNELRKLALSPGAADLLFAVKAIGLEATPAQISRWTFRQPHSVSGLLDRLEERGLLRRSKDLHQKHLARISLTEKGEEAFRAACEMSATKAPDVGPDKRATLAVGVLSVGAQGQGTGRTAHRGSAVFREVPDQLTAWPRHGIVPLGGAALVCMTIKGGAAVVV